VKIFKKISKEKKIEKLILELLKAYHEDKNVDKAISFFSDKVKVIGIKSNQIAETKEQVYNLIKRDIQQVPLPLKYKIISLKIDKIDKNVFSVNIIYELELTTTSIKIKTEIRATLLIVSYKIVNLHISSPYLTPETSDSHIYERIKQQKETLEKIIEEKTYELNKTIEKLKEVDNIKNTLFAILSHDLRAPFATAITLIELLEKKERVDVLESEAILTAIKVNFKNVFQLLENLIIWAKDQIEEKSSIKEEIDINTVLNEIKDIYENEIKNKKIDIVLDIKPISITINKNIISMILRNLIYNSIKYASLGGIIKIKNRKFKNNYLISIKDNGIGISHDKIEKILELNKNKTTLGTLKEKGCGLGLFLINQILNKNNGKIKIKSIENKGTIAAIFIKLEK